MNNRVDFSLGSQDRLALPAALANVWIDGQLTDKLMPIEIVYDSQCGLSRAKLRYQNSETTVDDVKSGVVQQMFGFGKALIISAFYNESAAESCPAYYPLFAGWVEKINTQISEDSLEVTVTAFDASSILERIIVFGRAVTADNDASIFVKDMKTVFNPDGHCNASKELIEKAGKQYRLFSADDGQGRLFTQADAICYLLAEYIPPGLMVLPERERLLALTQGRVLGETNVTGLSLLAALKKCCEGFELEFSYEPVNNGSQCNTAIVFRKKSLTRLIGYRQQKAGQVISITSTTASGIAGEKDFYPVTYRYIANGECCRYESTFQLIKAWDSGLEDENYDLFCPSSNPEFISVRDVYRLWALNEAGWYSVAPYNRGEAYDFTKLFEEKDYIRKSRRFHSCISCDGYAQSLGYVLDVSIDNGQSWSIYPGKYDVLTNQCAVRLTDGMLDENIFEAAITGQLKFRITASVSSDNRLSVTIADGPTESSCPVMDVIVKLPGLFRYNIVTSGSKYCNTEQGRAGKVDDTARLYAKLREYTAGREHTTEAVVITTPFLEIGYEVGDIIESCPPGADYTGSAEACPCSGRIVWLKYDFEKQCTQIKIQRTEKNFNR